jgi:transposase
MLRLTTLIAIAATVSLASGCTWQQAYASAQGWQRNACYRVPDQIERERCLGNANMSYADYRRRNEGPRPD